MSVYDDVSTIAIYAYPYRNEMVRLLLHSFHAIRVSFFIHKCAREDALHERINIKELYYKERGRKDVDK